MQHNKGLRIFSKLTCFSTLLLIFIGGMVTSTGSGLAVPDWPLSFGTLFPPMIGGVFYEHGHRMAAAGVGFLTLSLALWLGLKETRTWVKTLGFCALGAVILQGLLGGLTVLFFLPTPVSVAHALLAQTFFILTILIAYSQSSERSIKTKSPGGSPARVLKAVFHFIVLVYIQLILGALMRHTGSGLAIYDFPTMAGEWFPSFSDAMLVNINSWRFDNDFDPVTKYQVVFHFLHRLGAFLIFLTMCFINTIGFKFYKSNALIRNTVLGLDILIFFQICLGIMTVLTLKSPVITSFHVAIGASTLGLSVLLFLRMAPASYSKTKNILFS